MASPNQIVDYVRRLAITGQDLSSFAAEDAVETLLESWKAAIHDGLDLRVLLDDVNGVIEHLQVFRERVLLLFPELTLSERDDE
ncbi:hypothetical protein [Arenibaculum pallidiluteum]|uniref:hypothetical protein n=1 Tax=Arenibaculum pallidiluteum TaxID=2812559 RepID=UPI001A964A9F|nr:hypothetical protein [Arenibaculum pallidiluteum]